MSNNSPGIIRILVCVIVPFLVSGSVLSECMFEIDVFGGLWKMRLKFSYRMVFYVTVVEF